MPEITNEPCTCDGTVANALHCELTKGDEVLRKYEEGIAQLKASGHMSEKIASFEKMLIEQRARHERIKARAAEGK